MENLAYARNNKITGDPIAPLVPARCFEDNLLVNDDGSFGAGFRCNFPYPMTMGDDRRIGVYKQIKDMLNVLTGDYDVQFVWMTSRRSEDFIEQISARADADGLIKEYAREQAEQISGAFANGDVRWVDCFVFLVRKAPFSKSEFAGRAQSGAKTNFISKIVTFLASKDTEIAYMMEEWEKLKFEFYGYADSIFKSLEQMGALPTVLGPNEMLEVFYRYWNNKSWDCGGRPRKYDPSEELPLTDHFLTDGPDLRTEEGILYMDQRYHAIGAIRTAPEVLEYPQFGRTLLHSPLKNVTMIMTLRQGDLAERLKLLKRLVPQLEHQAKKDKSKESQYFEGDAEFKNLGKGIEKTWVAQQIFIVTADTREEVKNSWMELKKAAERTAGMVLEIEKYHHLEYFIAAHPCFTRDRDLARYLNYSTTQLATQAPSFGLPPNLRTSKGRPLPVGAIYETTSGAYMNLLSHDNMRFTRPHMMVLGASGTGKGVFINDYIAQMNARHRTRFIMIDIDPTWKKGSLIKSGSYRKTCTALAGNYVDMNLAEKGRVMNPFYTEGNHFPDADEIGGMVRFVEKLTAEDDSGLRIEEKAEVENAITQCFRKAEGKREVTLTNIRELLDNGTRTEHLSRRLTRWTGKGSYANLFDGPNQIDISRWMTVFDLSAIRENKEVSPLIFSVIFSCVAQMATKYPKEYKHLIFDECAEFLADPVIASYIEIGYRQMRKAGVAVIGMSQTLEEWLKTGSGGGYINNTAVLILLKQTGEDAANTIADKFRMTQDEREILLTLKSVPGEYSQALIWQDTSTEGRVSSVVVKRPTPIGYAMATSSPQDRTAFEEIRATGASYEEAIKIFAKNYPNGVARALLNAKK